MPHALEFRDAVEKYRRRYGEDAEAREGDCHLLTFDVLARWNSFL